MASVFGVGTAYAAQEMDFASGRLSISGAAHVGAAYRTRDADPGTLYNPNAEVVGLTGTAPGGRNSDDSNLNYRKGDPVSQIVKAWGSMTYTQGQYGATLSGKAWYDRAQNDHDVPFGNVINGYRPNTPLSDHGMETRAKFSGAVINDANLFGRNSLMGQNDLSWKLGWQRLDWGQRFFVTGGLRDLMPWDIPAEFRPGVQRDEETRIPIPLAFAKLDIKPGTSVEGFVQLDFTPNVMPGCGTFFAPVDYAAPGCNIVTVGGASDATAIERGSVVMRGTDIKTSSGGQFGVAFKHKLESLKTDLGFYATQFHSRSPYIGVTKSQRASGAPWIPGNPGQANPVYFLEYPDRIRMFSATFETALNPTSRVFGELSYRPNQPFSYNSLDLLNGFLTPNGPTPLRDTVNALAPGQVFDGFERHKSVQLQLGGGTRLPGILGANATNLGGQLAMRWVPDLPDVNKTRFRRPEYAGVGPVNGVCPGTDARQCSTDGYVSSSAWGYRLQAGLLYANVFDGVDVMPSIFFGHDVSGWTEDVAMLEGRKLAVLSLKAVAQKKYTAELMWMPVWGGAYNPTRDRSTAQIVFGMQF